MAVEKFTALANITLTSTASSVTFGSIPSGYRDLRLVANCKTAADVNIGVQVNGDTGSNYSYVSMYGDGSTTTSASGTPNYARPEISNPTFDGNFIMQLMDYSATDKHKTMLSRGNKAGNIVSAIASRWANTAAITSIAINAPGSSFNAGSTFELYGVA